MGRPGVFALRLSCAVVLAVALALLLQIGRGAGLRAAPEDTGPILGRVIDAATKKPIPGSLVSLWQSDRVRPALDGIPDPDLDRDAVFAFGWPTKPLRSLRTEARGEFAFPAATGPGSVWLTASATGYAAALADVRKGVVASIALSAVPLQRARFVRTTAAGAAAAAGAEVVLFPAGLGQPPSQRFTTDADGRVALPLDVGTEVLVRAAGCALWWGQGGPLFAKEDLRLRPAAPVSGVVRSRSGQPVAGAVVRLRSFPLWDRVQTDAAGRFRFDFAPADVSRIELEVEAPGCLRRVVEVTPGDTDVTLVVAPPSQIVGRVLDAAGKPVAGASVLLLQPPDEELGPLDAPPPETAADGTFRIDSAEPGYWVVEARLPGAGSAYRLIHVPVGGDAEGVELRPRRWTVPLAVRVVDEQKGLPVARVRVAPRADEPGRPTDAEGRVTVEVLPGEDGRAELFLSGGDLGAGTLRAHVSRAAVLRGKADVALTTSAILDLTVFDAAGRKLERSGWLAVVLLRSAPVELAVDPSSRFSGPDAAPLVPRLHPFRLLVASHGTKDALFDRVLQPGDLKAGALEVRLRPLSVARGRAVLPAGTDPKSVRVAARRIHDGPEMPGLEWAFGTWADGGFDVPFPTGGRWRLVVMVEDAARRDVLASRDLEVGDATTTDLGDLGDLAQAPLLRGTVRSSGRPVVGAVVAAEVGAPEASLTATAADGTWQLRVPRGAQGSVTAARDGLGSVGRAFASDGTAPIDLTMPAETAMILRNALDPGLRPYSVEIRSAGTVRSLRAHRRCGELEVDKLAPGPVEIVVGDAVTGRRTVRAEVLAGRVVEVDLATAK